MRTKFLSLAAVIGLTLAITPAAVGQPAAAAAAWQTVAQTSATVDDPDYSFTAYGAALLEIATHIDHAPTALRVVVTPSNVQRSVQSEVTCYKNLGNQQKTKSASVTLDPGTKQKKLPVPKMANPDHCFVYMVVQSFEGGFVLKGTLQEMV